MPKEYKGRTIRWARDEKTAISFICKNKLDKNKGCLSKKGAYLKILEVNEIHNCK
tara:strand:+ start:342 stop:506 length:165 start_codon:yes stop_codon:yes gene_type:complete